MPELESIFGNRKADAKKLFAFGFTKKGGTYAYSSNLLGGQFQLKVFVHKNGTVTADVYDTAFGEVYTPVKVSGAMGGFVGKVKDEYEKQLKEISAQCFSSGIFEDGVTRKVIEHIQSTYGDAPEFLWPAFPKNAIFRRKDNAKWYAALLNLPKSKIGLEGDTPIDIIDLRMETAELEKLIDGKKYFPGFHMNKKHWLTLCLDGSVPHKELCRRIEASYRLAKKR